MQPRPELAERFRALHHDGPILLLANAWDLGSARMLAALGFEALATTSSGHAATLGRSDGSVTREEALAHAAALAAAVEVPVSADLESGFAADPSGVAETVRGAIAAGLAGCSIEDATGDRDAPIHELALARERVAAAAEAAHAGPVRLVLTARAENHLHGRDDLADTISRLQAYEAAGADVVYAPGLHRLDDIRAVVQAVGVPVNVLTWPGAPPVAELAAAGVRRVSVGGAFAFAALAALIDAATELRDEGTYGFLKRARTGAAGLRNAL